MQAEAEKLVGIRGGAKGLASSGEARIQGSSFRSVFVSYVLTLSHSHAHTAISIAPKWPGEVGQ